MYLILKLAARFSLNHDLVLCDGENNGSSTWDISAPRRTAKPNRVILKCYCDQEDDWRRLVAWFGYRTRESSIWTLILFMERGSGDEECEVHQLWAWLSHCTHVTLKFRRNGLGAPSMCSSLVSRWQDHNSIWESRKLSLARTTPSTTELEPTAYDWRTYIKFWG